MKITDIFEVPDQLIPARSGRLLIAEPFMQDPYFKRSVVLLTEHNESGSFGLILNKPIPMYLHEAVDNAPEFDGKLALGGPVQKETLHFIHRKGEQIPGSMEIMEGVFWGGDFETVKNLMREGELTPTDIRMFIGYAGWSKDQLDTEMEGKSWIVSSANSDLIFSEKPKDLWKRILSKMGKPYQYMTSLPEDPRLN